ncbi:MAG: hypothetical protein HWE07_13920 [Cytophagia bacterium]|nr:hypothetical protein [Cytophagia bacterium]
MPNDYEFDDGFLNENLFDSIFNGEAVFVFGEGVIPQLDDKGYPLKNGETLSSLLNEKENNIPSGFAEFIKKYQAKQASILDFLKSEVFGCIEDHVKRNRALFLTHGKFQLPKKFETAPNKIKVLFPVTYNETSSEHENNLAELIVSEIPKLKNNVERDPPSVIFVGCDFSPWFLHLLIKLISYTYSGSEDFIPSNLIYIIHSSKRDLDVFKSVNGSYNYCSYKSLNGLSTIFQKIENGVLTEENTKVILISSKDYNKNGSIDISRYVDKTPVEYCKYFFNKGIIFLFDEALIDKMSNNTIEISSTQKANVTDSKDTEQKNDDNKDLLKLLVWSKWLYILYTLRIGSPSESKQYGVRILYTAAIDNQKGKQNVETNIDNQSERGTVKSLEDLMKIGHYKYKPAYQPIPSNDVDELHKAIDRNIEELKDTKLLGHQNIIEALKKQTFIIHWHKNIDKLIQLLHVFEDLGYEYDYDDNDSDKKDAGAELAVTFEKLVNSNSQLALIPEGSVSTLFADENGKDKSIEDFEFVEMEIFMSFVAQYFFRNEFKLIVWFLPEAGSGKSVKELTEMFMKMALERIKRNSFLKDFNFKATEYYYGPPELDDNLKQVLKGWDDDNFIFKLGKNE